jgi:signal transduction histidine kinase
MPIGIYSETFDFGRFNSPQYREQLRNYLREKYRDKPIGAIVVYGSSALEFLMTLHAEMWATAPIVFAVAGETDLARLKLPREATGTKIQLSFGNAVRAARALIPGLKRIALVGDPYERQPFFRHYIAAIPQFAGELEFINLLGLPMGDLRQRVAALPEDTAIVFSSLSIDGAGVRYVSRDALKSLAEVANRPIVSQTGTHIGYGSTGGYVVFPEPIGQNMARIALRILDGELASAIPMTMGDYARPVFDWRQLQRFGISDSSLPSDSEIRFRPVTIWQQYRWQMTAIVGAILVQAGMISWLLIERRRRRSVELESRGRLREVIHLDRVAAVGAMSASIAHELNQPLGAILANAEAAEMLLDAHPIDHDQLREILADIRQSDQRAADIISHLSGLLKKKGDVDVREIDVNHSIQDAMRILEPESRKRGVSLGAEASPGALLVRADRVHLQQAILNLAANAMDAMQEGDLTMRKMTIRTALTGSREVEVSVSDSGIGIPGDKLTTIFDTFYTTKPNGTGLGLSIVRTIVENFGGRIWAENRREGGAVFRFTLPLAGPPAR